jgi:hypothetical protein
MLNDNPILARKLKSSFKDSPRQYHFRAGARENQVAIDSAANVDF